MRYRNKLGGKFLKIKCQQPTTLNKPKKFFVDRKPRKTEHIRAKAGSFLIVKGQRKVCNSKKIKQKQVCLNVNKN